MKEQEHHVKKTEKSDKRQEDQQAQIPKNDAGDDHKEKSLREYIDTGRLLFF
jgi:hypothetical protein